MILVDSSVLVDYLRGRDTWQVEYLDRLLQFQPVATGDLMLTEVLQGCPSSASFRAALTALSAFEIITISDPALAIQAARNFQHLHRLGITVRKTIDTLIASRCIVNGLILLHSDRDFEPFSEHLGLKTVNR